MIPRLHCALCLLLALPTLAQASDGTLVRWTLIPDVDVVVGQRLTLNIDVFSKEGFASVSRLPPLTVKGAIVYAPPTSAIRLNETIEGESYSGSRTEVWIYPQRSGQLEVPGTAVEVSQQRFGAGKGETKQSLELKPLSITIEPLELPDVSITGVVVADDLELTQTWSEATGTTQLGDGITRTITQTAEGVPTLLLNPINFADLDGSQLAGRQPESENKFNRGSLTAKRVDSATYIFQKPGTFKLPDIEVAWYDSKDGKFRYATVEGREINVEAATSSTPLSTSDSQAPTAWRFALLALTLGIAAALIGLVARFGFHQRNRTGELDRLRLEKQRFRAMRKALKEPNAKTGLVATYQWSTCVTEQGMSLHQWMEQFQADPSALDAFETTMQRGESLSQASAKLLTELSKARRKYLTSTRKKSRPQPLPGLRAARQVKQA